MYTTYFSSYDSSLFPHKNKFLQIHIIYEIAFIESDPMALQNATLEILMVSPK